MRKILALLLAIMLAFVCVGCSAMNEITKEDDNLRDNSPVTFVEVGRVMSGRIMRCEQTNVLYVMSSGSYSYGSYTVLVNPDGTPMLWED